MAPQDFLMVRPPSGGCTHSLIGEEISCYPKIFSLSNKLRMDLENFIDH